MSGSGIDPIDGPGGNAATKLEPTRADVLAAAQRIGGRIRRTPVETSRQLDLRSGASIFLKCEQLQRTGAFKARGAANAVLHLDDRTAARGVACHSSGNHASALAWAAAERGIRCTVVMPSDVAAPKASAVAGYGAEIVFCEPTIADRGSTLAEVLASTGATEIHPYDHPDVIAGAGTAALELLEEVSGLDAVVTPVGGGGLLSGTILAVDGEAEIIGAEPLGADDAARSLAVCSLVEDVVVDTIADGLRAPLSPRTFGHISAGVSRIATVDDDEIIAAMRFCWERMKLVVEPSGSIGVALALRGELAGRRVGIVISGGNVDLDVPAWIR